MQLDVVNTRHVRHVVVAEVDVRCPGCGTEGADDAAACGVCGRVLRRLTDKVHAPTPTPTPSLLPSSSSPTPAPPVGKNTVPLAGARTRVTEGGSLKSTDVVERDEDRFKPGTVVLSHYTIERQLGRGGMGTVYLAVDVVSGQRVAVKVLPALLARDRDIRERFVLEARALASLDHPGIVPLITFAQQGDDRFLVMKYVAGKMLEALLQEQDVLSVNDARRILRAMCDALASAHDRGVIHRDIKPANVLLDDNGRVVIVDFGIARSNDGDRKLTEAGMLMGTPQYMSPEQIGGRPIDGRADLYACGLVLFEMLTGQPPFDGPQIFDVLRAQVDAPVPDLRRARRLHAPSADDVPDHLVHLCLHLLQKDPAARPATGHDVVAMLDGRLPIPAPQGAAPSAASLTTTPPSSRTAVTPALAFADEPPRTRTSRVEQQDDSDDDIDAVAAPWRWPLWLGLAGLAAVGGYAAATQLLPAPAPEMAVVVDAGPDDGADQRFAQAALVARAHLAFEQHRLDDARVAVDTALSLAGDPAPASLLLLRAEILVVGNNPGEAEATLRRLPATLTPSETTARDALRVRVAPAVEPSGAPKKRTPPPSPSTTPPAPTSVPVSGPPATPPDAPQTPPGPPRPSMLSDAALDAVTRLVRPQVSLCFVEHVLSVDEAATGSMTLDATIGTDGQVKRVTVTKNSFDNDPFTACVTAAVGRWQFAPFSGDDDVVTQHYAFKPGPTE